MIDHRNDGCLLKAVLTASATCECIKICRSFECFEYTHTLTQSRTLLLPPQLIVADRLYESEPTRLNQRQQSVFAPFFNGEKGQRFLRHNQINGIFRFVQRILRALTELRIDVASNCKRATQTPLSTASLSLLSFDSRSSLQLPVLLYWLLAGCCCCCRAMTSTLKTC